MNRLAGAYKGMARVVRQYWAAYGGWIDFAVSPYLHLSFLLTVLTCGTWDSGFWWDQVLSTVPNLLGFSLGALAIFLGFGNERFRDVISGRRPDVPDRPSPYMLVTAAFTHFIVIQILALVVSVLCAAAFNRPAPTHEFLVFFTGDVGRRVLWGFGYWLFLYALCLAAASVLAVFRIASWYDAHRTQERTDDDSSQSA